MFGTIGFGFSASGSGGGGGGIAAVTANNGLTATTISNVQFGSTTTLGVPLLHNTYLNLGNFGFTINGGASATFNLLINDTGVSKAEIISDSTAFVMQTTTNATNTVSGLDITSSFGGAGSIRRTDTVTGLYTGLYYLGSEVGWNVNNGVTQFEYHFPPAPYVANSVLADISGTGFLTWATIGSIFTADNGLTKSSATNVQLGGTLLKNTSINASTFYLELTGSITSAMFRVNKSGTGYAIDASNVGGFQAAIRGTGTSGAGVQGIATVSNGVTGTSTNSAGVAGSSTTGSGVAGSGVIGVTGTGTGNVGGDFSSIYTTNNDVGDSLTIQRYTSNSPSQNGIGTRTRYWLPASDSTMYITNYTVCKLTNVTAGSLVSDFEIWNRNAGLTRVFNLAGSGKLTLDKYGIGNFTGTQTFNLGVDSLGNVIETLNTTLRHGSFFDTTIQTTATANTATPMKLNNTDSSATSTGVSVANNLSGNPTRITVDTAGIYNLQFSTQIDRTSGGALELIYIWIQVNGTAVPNSATKMSINSNNDSIVGAWNWFVTLAANQYVEIMWSATANTIRLLAESATAPAPAIPSVIATITKV